MLEDCNNVPIKSNFLLLST